MMRTMYDGTNRLAAGIHRAHPDAELVAGYVDGEFAWTAGEWALFDPASHVQFAVFASTNAGDILDVERGNAQPSQCEGWITKRRVAGLWRPTVYCSLSLVPAVRQGTGKWVLGRDYDLLVADYDGKPASVYPGSIGTQYQSTASWDVSAIFDSGWPHRKDPAAAPGAYTWPSGEILREYDTDHSAVHVLQEALNRTGLRGVRNIADDGVFGPQTLTSLRNYQSAERLVVDGVAGPVTRAALGVK